MPNLDTRIAEIEARVNWCKIWLNRQGVQHPQITQEWRNLLEDTGALLTSLRDMREALADLIVGYEHATEHITKELQPEFETLAEEGVLTWRWPNEPYDQAQAAWRLATWWHGVGTDERLARARAALAPEQTKGAV